MLGFTFFRSAGATGHVFHVRRGRFIDRGLAHSGLIGPWTTVAVVPTILQVIPLSVEALTQDQQPITVVGDLKLVLDPGTVIRHFDFSVQAKSGSYVTSWERTLHALVQTQVVAPIQECARELNVTDSLRSHTRFETAVGTRVMGDQTTLMAKGIRVESCSVVRVEPEDDDLAQALGATERELLLTAADRARHERQLVAATNARAVKTYEAETARELERKRTELLELQGKNERKKAGDDAEALKLRLEPLTKVAPGVALAASLMKLAEGRVGTVNFSPDLLAALNGTAANAS